MELSRYIEDHLSRDEEDYELEVGSAGLGQPFKVPQQYHCFVGKTVHEIAVFRIELKGETVPTDVLVFIDRKMPRHTLFLLQHDDDFCLLVNYKEWHDAANTRFDIVKTFQTGWTSADKLSLSLDGQDMDAVYSAIVKQVAGADITSEAKDIHTAVAQTKEQEALRQKIAALEAKIAKERQPKKKFELHQQLVKLKENNE